MSRYVKQLISDNFSSRLEGVEEALLVNVIGLDANKTVSLRRHLREKDISLMVIRNGLARRAFEGSPLASALDQAEVADNFTVLFPYETRHGQQGSDRNTE